MSCKCPTQPGDLHLHHYSYYRADINRKSSNVRLYVNYVSDPPGSKQFDGVYDIEGDEQTKLVLDHYQLVTEERTPKL